MIFDCVMAGKVFCKELMERDFFKSTDAQDLQNAVQTLRQTEFLADDGHQHVDADGDPDLGFHRVGRCSVKSKDSQVLLDPLEEKLRLPPAFVELCDGERWQSEVIGEKKQMALLLGIEEVNPTQTFRVILSGVEPTEFSDLVGTHPRSLDDRQGLAT